MNLRQVAVDTLELIERGRYVVGAGSVVDFAAAQRAATEGTRLYTPPELGTLLAAPGPGGARATVHVTDETTQVGARRLAAEGEDLVLLNFASARNPGGGFLGGAKAQEEDVCRCSGLYPTLLRQPVYYEVNRHQRSLLYTDHMIYTPRVPFFRDSGRGPLLDEVFLASVITAPAPNAGPLLRLDPDAGPSIAATFERRWGAVLSLARETGHRTVLLGAWGCGAFGNDPRVASEAVAGWLDSDHFAGAFDSVVFAIPGRGKRSAANLEVFRARLGSR